MRLFTVALYVLSLTAVSVAYTTPKKSSTSSRSSTSPVKPTTVYPSPTTSTSTSTSTPKATSTSTVSGATSLWGQCGGIGFTGPHVCSEGVCTFLNGTPPSGLFSFS
ncbi:hypothetical protein PIIN_06069 [Serendipita indica DSM 11827]|uniref:CBM1 domain-containing protein n=1 Tax=Serendipita indica (strain DSM 11827) TaxID=1109443 RepID=G4TLE0_SERID|nr:hypothetical protein PIIN_06069 [Serendipita indica DSM 11827]